MGIESTSVVNFRDITAMSAKFHRKVGNGIFLIGTECVNTRFCLLCAAALQREAT